MSLIKQKSQVFENSNQLYAKYEPESKSFIIDCNEGLTWYISNDCISQLTECFNVKIINIYKNINKAIRIIYCNSNYFGNKVMMTDKHNIDLFGDEETPRNIIFTTLFILSTVGTIIIIFTFFGNNWNKVII